MVSAGNGTSGRTRARKWTEDSVGGAGIFVLQSSRLLRGAEMMIFPGAGIWKTLLLLSTAAPNCSEKFELRRAMCAVTWEEVDFDPCV
jgi:hypothetical protein